MFGASDHFTVRNDGIPLANRFNIFQSRDLDARCARRHHISFRSTSPCANALQALADPNPRPADHPDRFTAPDTCSAAAIVLPRGPARTRRLMTSKPHRRGISGATYVPPSDGRSVLCGDGRSRTVENLKRASTYPCDRLDGRGALAGPEPAPVHACATVGPEVTLVPRSAPPWTLVQPHAT